jgi:ATP-binding cassette subfamily B (MDR/TAP) protein 1
MGLTCRRLRWDRVLGFSRMHLFSGMGVHYCEPDNITLLNSLSGKILLHVYANVSFMALTIGGQAAGQFLYLTTPSYTDNSSFAPDISKAKSSSINVNRLMERVPVIDSWSAKGKRIESLETGHLEFKDVHFRYPTRPHVPVLRGLNFEVKPGQYVALVGSSGCGKSTAVGLIERFYDPMVGEVLVDGMNVGGYNLSEYRKNISLVSQEPTYSSS